MFSTEFWGWVMTKSKPVLCVGIDHSLNGTGIAAINSKGEQRLLHGWTTVRSKQKEFPESLSYFKIKEPQSHAHRIHRLISIYKWVRLIINRFTDDYDVFVAIEGYALSAKGGRVSDQHEGMGLIKAWLWRMNIPFRIYTPTTVKSAWTGKGSADKSAMLMTCYQKFGLDLTPLGEAGENLADALLIARLLYWELAERMIIVTDGKPLATVRNALAKVTKEYPTSILQQDFIIGKGQYAEVISILPGSLEDA